jgi:tellurite resistance protein TehA-like permease
VSLAADMLGMAPLARGLFHLNIAMYGVLWVLMVTRAVFWPRRFCGDLVDHLRGWGFFTAVAASGILGEQFLTLAGNERAAWLLWGVALGLWVCLTYVIFIALIIKPGKPSLRRGINGGWLLAVVATQSLASLSLLLVPYASPPQQIEMVFFALSMWLWGGMLYIWMMSLIFCRYTFFPFSPGDLSPPYWINMGAMAISTLAGSVLISNAPDAPFLLSLLPFIKGFTVFYWATGTWWIPMLMILAVWRYLYRRFPIRYDPLYWGAVFPLGMYAAGTRELIDAMGLLFLDFLPTVFLYIALVVWLAAFAGLALDVVRRVRSLRA